MPSFLAYSILDEMESELEVTNFIMSSKGHAQLVDKAGQVYNRHKTNQDQTVIYWRCREHRKSGVTFCNGRVQTQGFYITKHVGIHSHPPPDEKLQIPV